MLKAPVSKPSVSIRFGRYAYFRDRATCSSSFCAWYVFSRPDANGFHHRLSDLEVVHYVAHRVTYAFNALTEFVFIPWSVEWYIMRFIAGSSSARRFMCERGEFLSDRPTIESEAGAIETATYP